MSSLTVSVSCLIPNRHSRASGREAHRQFPRVVEQRASCSGGFDPQVAGEGMRRPGVGAGLWFSAHRCRLRCSPFAGTFAVVFECLTPDVAFLLTANCVVTDSCSTWALLRAKPSFSTRGQGPSKLTIRSLHGKVWVLGRDCRSWVRDCRGYA